MIEHAHYSDHFEQFLLGKKIPLREVPYYIKWVRMFERSSSNIPLEERGCDDVQDWLSDQARLGWYSDWQLDHEKKGKERDTQFISFKNCKSYINQDPCAGTHMARTRRTTLS